jgi:hypothetical protein
MFAESERDFFLKVVDAQVTFEVDAEGRVTEWSCTRTDRTCRANGSDLALVRRSE